MHHLGRPPAPPKAGGPPANLNCLEYYIRGFMLSTHIFITTGIVGIDLNNVEGLTVSAPDTFTAEALMKSGWTRHVDDAVAAVRPGDAVAVRVVSQAKR